MHNIAQIIPIPHCSDIQPLGLLQVASVSKSLGSAAVAFHKQSNVLVTQLERADSAGGDATESETNGEDEEVACQRTHYTQTFVHVRFLTDKGDKKKSVVTKTTYVGRVGLNQVLFRVRSTWKTSTDPFYGGRSEPHEGENLLVGFQVQST